MTAKAIEHRQDGVTSTVEYDATDDRFIIGSHQDVAPVLDHVAKRNNDGTGGWSPSRDLRLLASIPEAVYDGWLREAMKQGIPLYHKKERDRFLKRKLAEHRKLTVAGRDNAKLGYRDTP